MSDGALTEAELSTATGAAPELVRRLVALGIVPGRDGERPFVPGDVHRVRLAKAYERSGIPLERSALPSRPGTCRPASWTRCSSATPRSPAGRSGRSPTTSASRWRR